MTKATRIKTAAADFHVPQTQQQAVDAVADIGRHQRERTRIETEMNDALARLREEYEAQALPHAKAITQLTNGVHLWAEAHRDDLTEDGKKKTATLASGELRWRMRPPSVSVRGADAVLETLKQLGLTRFIRVKEEVNRDAVLADADAVSGIKGLSVIQKEDFVVVPWETELEQVA